MEVGDIYTNGTNYWMIIDAPEEQCECCKRPVNIYGTKCVPVIVDRKNHKIESIAIYRITTLESIKPHVYLAYKANFTNVYE